MPRLLACIVAAALCLGIPSTAATSRWMRLRTPNFVLMSEAGEGTLRRVAERFEQFREVFARLIPATSRALPAPTLVLVFGNERAYRPFMPLYNGKRVDVGGFFQRGEGMNFITLNAQAGEDAYPTIFHEYTHLLVGSGLMKVPLWFNEGLAEYYSTFAMTSSRTASLGMVHRAHVWALRERFLPLAELFRTTHGSPLYNEGDRRSIFYAESWALVHYLVLGNPTRRSQLTDYLVKYADGMPHDRAFAAAFGIPEAQLEEELRLYVQRSIYQSQIHEFDERVAVGRDWHIDRVDAAEGEAALADLLRHMRRHDEAAARLEPVLAQSPDHPRALAVLGRVREAQGRRDEALALLERATAAAGDDYLPAYYRADVMLRGRDGAPPPDEAAGRAATPLLETVVRQQPSLAHAHALLGYARLLANDGAGALDASTAAFRLSPRHEYALIIAQAAMRAGKTDQARTLLTSLKEQGSSQEIRAEAQRWLTLMAEHQGER